MQDILLNSFAMTGTVLLLCVSFKNILHGTICVNVFGGF